jgi:hypothetical protein
LELNYDEYPEEISWQLKSTDESGDAGGILSAGDYNGLMCFDYTPGDCFEFVIWDERGIFSKILFFEKCYLFFC